MVGRGELAAAGFGIQEPGIEQQAVGRICRIGQTKATRCIRLIVADTIESNILEWQRRRLCHGASASTGSQQLALGDFVHVLGREREGARAAIGISAT